MVRQVLSARVADVLGGSGCIVDDGPPPPPPQAALDAVFRMPSGGPETEEQATGAREGRGGAQRVESSGRHVRLRMSEI